ncbi:MAG: hypothetical protein ACOYK9_01710 [Chlamydiia bacterium]
MIENFKRRSHLDLKRKVHKNGHHDHLIQSNSLKRLELRCGERLFFGLFFKDEGGYIQNENGLFSYSCELSLTGQSPTKERGNQ